MNPLVLVPAYDEAATVGAVVRRARTHAPVIVIDDGSRDGTADAAARAGAEVCRHVGRRGKARALLTGVAAARERGATHVVTLDADGQHDPDDLPALLSASGPRTLVIGVRAGDRDALPAGRADPVVDGVAIGAHLGSRSLVRAAHEASAAAGAVASVASRRRTRERHALMLEG